MRIRYIGESIPLALTKGKEYEVLAIEKGPGGEDWYRIITDMEMDYLFLLEPGKDYEEIR